MYIHAIGHFHPENIIDNYFLQELDIGSDPDWIVRRTGIHTRHTVLNLDYIRSTHNRDSRAADEASLYSNEEAAVRATEMALKRAGLQATDIGMIIVGQSVPRWSSPAEACLVGEKLGIGAPCFDMNSACTSWAVPLHMLSGMRPETLPDFILLVNPENLTRVVDYSDRRNAVLMGDCTTATIVSARVPSRLRIGRTMMQSDPAGWRKVTVALAGHLDQDGPAVQRFAIRYTVLTVENLRGNTKPGFLFVGHQANLPMLESICTRAEIPPARHLYNVDRRGNCAAAGAPSVLSEHFSELKAGDHLLVAVVGAGLTWAGVTLEVRDC